jgi:hypothetical protein
MPYYYFDSTALVKRYSMERGTRVVNKLMVKRGKVAILPMWSVTELYSVLSVRAQQGEITRTIVIPSSTSSRWKPRKDSFSSSRRRWRPIWRQGN